MLEIDEYRTFIIFLFSFFILLIVITFIGTSRPTIIKLPYDHDHRRKEYDDYYNRYN